MNSPNSRADLLASIANDSGLTALLKAARKVLGGTEKKPADPGHDLTHALRVALWTLRLAPTNVDPREAIAAALLHDLVNVPKNHPDRARASERSAQAALKLLPDAGFTPDASARVAQAIADHSFSRGAVPSSDLGRALQDADRLEALGAIGLARTFSTGARMGAQYAHPDDPWASARPFDDRAFTVDHFHEKLFRLAPTLCTEAGRAEARRRTERMRQFVRDLGEELGEGTPEWIDLAH